MTGSPRLTCVLLAAGASRRFGGRKQLAQLNADNTLLEHSLTFCLQAYPHGLHVVLGAYQQEIQQRLQLHKYFPQVRVLINHDWHSGMASSISCALNRISPDHWDGVLLVLADQIALTSEHLKAMHAQWLKHPDKIVACEYCGILGAPVIFPHQYFDKLNTLSGDQGAKLLLHEHRANVLPFELADAEIDIDTQQQLHHWQRDKY